MADDRVRIGFTIARLVNEPLDKVLARGPVEFSLLVAQLRMSGTDDDPIAHLQRAAEAEVEADAQSQ